MLQSLVAQADDLEFVHWDTPGCEVLLILNACPVGCSSRPSFLGRLVVVTSDAIDYWPVAEVELSAKILEALRRSETSGSKKS